MKKINKNGGFTLVELIISMGIAVSVIALTCTVLASSFNFFSRDNDLTQAKVIGDIVMDHMTDNLRYATALEIADKEENLSPSKNKYAMTITDGRLYEWETADKNKSLNDTYGEDFYRGMTMSVTSKVNPSPNKRVIIDKANSDVESEKNNPYQNQWLTIKLELTNRQKEILYKTEKTFELVNFTANIETHSSDTGTLNEKNLHVMGNATGETVDAVLCYDAEKVNNRQDYIPAPSDMYIQVKEYLKLSENKVDQKAEMESVLGYAVSDYQLNDNGYIREYIQKKYYEGKWPKLSRYISDISQYSPSEETKRNAGKPDKLPNNETYLEKLDLEMVFHYDKGSGSVIIYAANSGGKEPWQPYLIYNMIQDQRWYTYLPTRDISVDDLKTWTTTNACKSLPQLAREPRFRDTGMEYDANGTKVIVKTEEEYDAMIAQYWKPLK